MFTNLPQSPATLLHPVALFDIGSEFGAARRALDGAAVLQQYVLSVVLPASHAYVACEAPPVPGPQAPRRSERADVGPRAEHVLVLDPSRPLPDVGGPAPTVHWPARELWCTVSWEIIPANTWGVVAFVPPKALSKLRKALGAALPEPPARCGAEEWLLRHAFSDLLLRENAGLAHAVGQLPMVFNQAKAAGRIEFGVLMAPVLPREHWAVIAIDTQPYLRD